MKNITGGVSAWNAPTPWQSGSVGEELGHQFYNEYKDHRWSKTISAIGELISDAADRNPPTSAGFSGHFSSGGHFIGGR